VLALHETCQSCWTRAHLLRHCEGYRVISTAGEIGYVESLLVSEEGEPEALAVRVGGTFSQLVPVAFEDIADVDPNSELIVIHSLADPTEIEPQLRIPALA
jgi:hypothetical protein